MSKADAWMLARQSRSRPRFKKNKISLAQRHALAGDFKFDPATGYHNKLQIIMPVGLYIPYRKVEP